MLVRWSYEEDDACIAADVLVVALARLRVVRDLRVLPALHDEGVAPYLEVAPCHAVGAVDETAFDGLARLLAIGECGVVDHTHAAEIDQRRLCIGIGDEFDQVRLLNGR